MTEEGGFYLTLWQNRSCPHFLEIINHRNTNWKLFHMPGPYEMQSRAYFRQDLQLHKTR